MKARLVIYFICAVLLSACSYTKIEFEKESGKVNKLSVGQKFRVSLPEDHKSQYLWGLKTTPGRNAEYINSVFHGTYVDFNFTALSPGSQDLTFYLYRARDTSLVKTFVVTVE
jgi:predicted secreted protein